MIRIMTKFAKILLLILLSSIFSCEKPQINNGINQQEQTSIGTINATTTYIGTSTAKWCRYFICDINQLDLIMTLTQQIHEAYMNGDYKGSLILSNTLIHSIQPIYKETSDNSRLSYNIAPGTYIVMSERRINYDYANIYPEKTDVTMLGTFGYLYKVIQVESGQTYNVAFVFQDYKPQ